MIHKRLWHYISQIIKKYLKVFGFSMLLIMLTPSVKWLFGSGYFNMHDDLQVLRIYEMVRCFEDGQIPCRWSPDMTNGYGQAMFNFYSAFPYYLGFFYKIIFSASYLGTVKFLFAVSLISGGIGMFFLGRILWGNVGGLIASILYTYSPYHAVDVYVRGALAESFALGVLPFIWLFSYKIIKKYERRDLILLSFSLFALFTTHNISMLIYAPFTIVWILFWLYVTKNYKNIMHLALSGFLALGMASFFIIPAIFEQNLINISLMTTVYYEFTAHFVTLHQLFLSRFWGDGGSTFGENDGMSFAIGWPHWWNTFLIVPVVSFWLLIKKNQKHAILIFLLLAFFLFVTFLTHGRSTFIWKNITLLSFVQFPWRFLGLSMFFISLVGGAVGKFPAIVKYPVSLLLIALTFYFNISYFTPINYSRLVTDESKLSGLAWELQQKGGAGDYIPKDVRVVPEFSASKDPKIISGKGVVRNFQAKSNGFSLNVELEEDSELVFPYIYFPKWRAYMDGVEIPVETDGAHDVIKLTLTKGEHLVSAEFYNTPIRSFANTVSLLSFLIFLIVTCKQTRLKYSKKSEKLQ